MGCVSAGASKSPAIADQGSGGNNDPSEKRLLDEYSVGQTLGEGAFGVVSVCKKRSTGEEFAVKMVDKVETPVEAIRKEADMLQSMDHPNIVKFHGVYNERCFVCIVMNKLDGGDLVEGLQRHLKEKGQINCHDVVHVSIQMASSIAYLHKRNVVHRDIKGDNYLMDRKNMTDKHCRIVLTDFGTACHASPTERLSSGVGTKIFWPPEFFDRDYGHKVDVWAMGVIMYGLVSGRFPFRDETDVRNKEVRIPKRVHPVCEEYIRKMLDKNEKSRMSSQEALQHAWVAGKGVDVVDVDISSKGAEQDDGAGEGMAESGVNDGVKERRQELIKRLHKEAEIGKGGPGSGKSKPLQNHKHKKFTVADKIVQGGKAIYEWWPETQVKQAKLMELEDRAPAPKETSGDIAMFKKTLVEHNIDPNLFGVGEAKEIGQLATEVETGASRLMLDAEKHKKLVRVVDIVVLKLRPTTGSDRLLIEFKERYPDGRERSTVRLPGTKKEPHENARQTAERILKEMLSMDPTMVQLDFSTVERQEEEKDSPSFPGVTTIYRRELVDCIVSTSDTKQLNKVGLPDKREWKASDAQGNTKFFTWMTDLEATTKVNLKGQGSQISTLVRAPIGLDEEALTDYLKSLKVDISKFGVNGAKSLKEFSTELVKGETRLLQVDNGQILVITEVVMMVLQKQDTKEVLVQTSQLWPDGKQSDAARVPGAKRRPDENQFLCARRILRRQLEIDENAVILSQDVGYIEEDRPTSAYPGLKTVYRKRVIRGQVVPGL